jgi:DNA-binding Xre family transcriptional regulator
MAIRLKIKEAAQAQKLSMARLSRLADVDYKTLQRIHRDPYKNIDTDTLDKLAKALHIKPEELIEGE